MYKRLKCMRENSNLCQQDIADYIHCTQTCYSHYELGTRDIPTDILIRLSEIYNTSVDYLLEITDERKPYPKVK